ncbi:MAG: PEPxxWA-CTERM sorting domain-containing protein [Qipengyuania sp.]|nr:PEPxxWA-CTERM sorting domain-containing protein [Qipengyuania sp.]
MLRTQRFRRVDFWLENEDGWALPAGEEALKYAIALCVALSCAIAAPPVRAQGERFEFRQFFATGSAGSLTITGNFTGELENGRITRISDIYLFRDGVPFRGNGALYTAQFDPKTRRWSQGGYLSLDGSANNIMFVDTDYGGGDAGFFNYFYSVTGIGNATFQPSFYRYRVPQTTQLELWQAAVAVPEPSAWALLAIGFGALGAAMRRRPASRPRTA